MLEPSNNKTVKDPAEGHGFWFFLSGASALGAVYMLIAGCPFLVIGHIIFGFICWHFGDER